MSSTCKCKITDLPLTVTEFHEAVQDGDLEKVKKMLDEEPNSIRLLANSKDRYGNTLLFLAVLDGKIEMAKCLIDNGADVDMKNDSDGATPLHLAAIYGEIEIVKSLIDNGAQVDLKDPGGSTPLHCAVFTAQIEVVKCLIEHGAQVDSRDKNNKTPSDKAVQRGHYEIATYLLEKKRESDNRKPEEIISNKAPCITCLEPRNGFFVLNPCGHASLCELCTQLLIRQDSKCPICRKTIRNYTKMFFQEPEGLQ